MMVDDVSPAAPAGGADPARGPVRTAGDGRAVLAPARATEGDQRGAARRQPPGHSAATAEGRTTAAPGSGPQGRAGKAAAAGDPAAEGGRGATASAGRCPAQEAGRGRAAQETGRRPTSEGTCRPEE